MQFCSIALTKKSSSSVFSTDMEECKSRNSVANIFHNAQKRISLLSKATFPRHLKRPLKSQMIFCRAKGDKNYFAISQLKTDCNLLRIATQLIQLDALQMSVFLLAKHSTQPMQVIQGQLSVVKDRLQSYLKITNLRILCSWREQFLQDIKYKEGASTTISIFLVVWETYIIRKTQNLSTTGRR